jgi:cytochrome c556
MRYVLLALVTIILFATAGASQEKKPVKDLPKVNPLMADKLKNSQGLLEALAVEDFAKMQKHSDELMRISKAAEWTVYKTPMYEVQTNNFRRALETLTQKAKAKNLDGATLAYVDMTVTCVRCHQHCRDVRDTSFIPGSIEE